MTQSQHRNADLAPIPMTDPIHGPTWEPLPGSDAWYSTTYGGSVALVPVIVGGCVEMLGVAVAVSGPGGVDHGVPLSASDAEEILRHLQGGHRVRPYLALRASIPIEIDESQIHALRDESAEAGDLTQVEICDRALDGDERARAECQRVLAAARAMW